MLIFDLAAADLALAFTIPFSARIILSKYWPWGSEARAFCQIIHSSPVTMVFMVSIIIIVIACDRYRCIVLRNQATQVCYKHFLRKKQLMSPVSSYIYIYIYVYKLILYHWCRLEGRRQSLYYRYHCLLHH